MFRIIEHKKKAGKYCCAHGCKNDPVKKKAGLCHKHYRRKLRELDPVQVRYNSFRYKARARGLENTITLGQFRLLCQRTGYIIKKGMRGLNATIDRRCNVHGYHIWNVQIMSNRQNASKGNKFSGDNFDCPF